MIVRDMVVRDGKCYDREAYQQGRADAIDEMIHLIDTYPTVMDIDRRTEEAHLIFAILADVITKINLLRE